ncbi:MAG TPA: orotate phosphoribosyltransferase [Candidatus Dormibacteraeota bacterium]|nr:orotate phosphoribosyltransferase [Candidatus Dormibacteraeota bacterium]
MSPEEEERRELLGLMLKQAFRVGDFLLASGRRSPYYFDGRLVTLDPRGALLVGRAVLRLARGDKVTKIGGPTLGADPMVTAVALCSALDGGPQVSAFIVRKEVKEHGVGGWCAGPAPQPGEVVALVDDALTSGGSLLQAADKVAASGAQIVGLYTLLDRQEGGRERLEAAGYRTRSVFVRSDLLTAGGQALPPPE